MLEGSRNDILCNLESCGVIWDTRAWFLKEFLSPRMV